MISHTGFRCAIDEHARCKAKECDCPCHKNPPAAEEMGQPVERCDDCPRLYDTEGPRCDECPPLPSPQSVEDKKAGSQRAADVNEIMKIVMKTAAKIAVERPDLQINSNLPLLRETHPEWFDSESDKTNTE